MLKTYPLTGIEQAFWYQQALDASDTSNHIVHKITFLKTIGEEELRAALKNVCQTNPLLRSRFVQDSGVPKRVIGNSAGFELRVEKTATKDQIDSYIHAPFNLETDELVRCLLVGGTELYVCVPHIVFDDVSWNIFCRELADSLGGKNLPVKELPTSSPSSTKALGFWKQEIADAPPRVELLGDVSQDAEALLYSQQIEPGLAKKLHQLAVDLKVTPQTLFSALAAVLLYKLSAQPDFIMATPVTIRDHKQTDDVGAFINVLPVRYQVNSTATFANFVREQGRKFWFYIENRQFSLTDLAAASSRERSADSTPLYNVMNEYIAEPDLKLAGIKDVQLLPNPHAKLDLTIAVTKKADGQTRLQLECDGRILSKDDADLIVSSFVALAENIAQSPAARISELSILNASAAKKIIELGEGPTANIDTATVWERFSQRAAEHPSDIAIKHKGQDFSYAQLNNMALTYANGLTKNGVSTGSVVAACLPRSSEFIASMLAIWAVGAVYLPIEVKHPKARIASILDVAKPKLVIANDDTVASLPANFPAYVVGGSDAVAKPLKYKRPDASEVAYVIFTSGSTGTPKGVMIKHIGFLNHLEMMVKEFGLKRGSCVAQTASAAFDISVWQLICPLIVGGAVCIYDEDVLLDANNLYTALNADGVNVLEIVPSLLSAYLEAEDTYAELTGGLAKIDLVTTGEAITPALMNRWFGHYPGKKVWNAYGPAEASDDTHFHLITPEDAVSKRPVPIGRPLLNIKTYVLDADMQLCPVGVVGEIYIGGIAVAKGYFNDEARTKEAFVADPYLGGTIYKTGDFGRWLKSGLLEYRGRRDSQVKIRGQRLELGEIERQLMAYSGVKEAAVLVNEQAGNKRLVAFVSGNNASGADLKDYLNGRLPAYMVPWKCIVLEDLPHNSSGKIDRRVLAEHPVDQQLEQAKPAPAKAELIAAVMSRVLSTKMNASTNFFDASGDSLSCARAVALLNKEDIRLSIKDVLTHQTPAELAAVLDSGSKPASPTATKLKHTPIQLDYLEGIKTTSRDAGEVQAVLFDLAKPIDPDKCEEMLQKIVKRHSAMHVGKTYKILQSSAKSSDLDALVGKLRKRIDLKEGPLFVAQFVGRKLLLVAHHFAVDIASWPAIITELSSNELSPRVDDEYFGWWQREYNQANPSEAKYWLQVLTELKATNNYVAGQTQQQSVKLSLSPDAEKQLRAAGADLESLAYYAVASAFCQVTGQRQFGFMVESTARALDRTGQLKNAVGWMTYLYPRVIKPVTSSLGELQNVYSAGLQVPHHGLHYGLHKHLLSKKSFSKTTEPIWRVNYIGQALETPGAEVIKTPSVKARPFVEVDVVYASGKLELQCMHNLTGKQAAEIADILKTAAKVCEQLTTDLNAQGEVRQFDLAAVEESRLSDILERLQK